ncbi:hypothetical protein [Salinigranum halophilum]|jgi:hypothetical protein|uniref:hypothetical protein n=1 Tax=Salinigranum halophilum TaxID=2565931 RepID=UPI0013754D86|nr:hypothetical protein [Salinigranum halophilum]
MDTWDHREARALVDAFVHSEQLSADAAARAHDLIDSNQPVRALELVRAAASYATAVG